MYEDCIMCNLFVGFQDNLMEYAKNIFVGFGEPLGSIIEKFMILWIVWNIAYNALSVSNNPINVRELLKQFFMMVFAVVTLRSGGSYWFDLLLMPFNLASAISIKMYEIVTDDTLGGKGFIGLINAIEEGSLRAFNDTIDSMFTSIGWSALKNIFYVILFSIAFFFMAWEMMKQITISLVKYMLIVILFPFFLAFGLFPLTRRVFFNAIRILLVSSFEIMAAVTLSALALNMNKTLIQLSPYNNLDSELPQNDFYNSDGYWTIIISMFIIGIIYRQIMEVVNQVMEVSADGSFRKNLSPSKIKDYAVTKGRAGIEMGRSVINKVKG